MSDFLSRLADRALGQAPLVEPLVRSRYGPASDLGLELDETVTATVPARRAESAPAIPEATSSFAAAADAASTPPRADAPPGQDADAPDALPSRSVHRRPGLEPPTGALLADPEADPTRAAEPEQHESAAAIVAPSLPTEPPLRARAPRGRTLLPPAGRARAARAKAEPELAPELAHTPAPDPAVSVPAAARDQPPAAVVHPGSRKPATAVARPPAPAEPPSVRVTIGRVEVRAPAATPPAPAPPASDWRPGLTLDEYLLTRGGIG